MIEYLGSQLGAVGDYNGDGIDDFVAGTVHNDARELAIFLGNRDWQAVNDNVAVPEDFDIDLSAYPNPFNDYVTITVNTNRRVMAKLDVFNLHGELVRNVFLGNIQAGSHEYNWECSTSGVYFIVISVHRNGILSPLRVVKIASVR